MFSASVWAESWGPEVSFLDVSGGSKRDAEGASDFLIWEMPHELKKSDRIAFLFADGADSSPKGTKFDSNDVPPMEPTVEMSFPPGEEDITKLEARPALNGALQWLVTLGDAQRLELAPTAVRQHISLHLLWNEEHPERLRVNLSRTSLREIFSRSGGEQLCLEYLPVGSMIEIAIAGEQA